MAGFFPIFFKQYWNDGVDVTVSSFRLGAASSIASLIVALLAPILGAVSDAGQSAHRWLVGLALLGAALTGALYFVAQGAWTTAAAVYVGAVIGFSMANMFYDALLVHVAPTSDLNRVSAQGLAWGYLGGGVLFAINVAMTLKPAVFGLESSAEAVRWSFVTVAVWWATFQVPLARSRIVYIDAPERSGGVWRTAFSELGDTIAKLRSHRAAAGFLLAYWIYIDGVHTIVRMAVDYGLSIGFSSNDLIAALLLVQLVGFPATLAFGRMAQRLDGRRAILVGLVGYIVITAWGAQMTSLWEFYVLAGLIGCVQGGVTSLSRSVFAQTIPAENSAQFFGFYNAVGRFAAVLGPVLMGWVALTTGNPRLSILALLPFFVVGGFLLMRLRSPES